MLQRSQQAFILLFSALLGAFLVSLFLVTLPGMQAASAAPAASLEITLFAEDKVHVDEMLTYTLRISNTGSSTLDPVYISDTWSVNLAQDLWNRDILPYFVTYTADPPSAVTFFTHVHNLPVKRGEAYWHLGALGAGEGVEIVFSVTVPITLEPALGEYDVGRVGPSSIENSVVVDAPGEATETAHNATMVTAPLLRTTLSTLSEIAPDDSVRVGRLLTLSWSIANLEYEGSLPRPDGEDAQAPRLYVLLPAQLIHSVVETQTDVPGVATAIDPSSGWFTWTFPADYILPLGDETRVTMVTRLPADTAYNPATQKLNFNRDDMLIQAAQRTEPEWSLLSIKRNILGPFDKVVETTNPPSRANYTYPGRYITYTLTFYNPLQTDISGALLTDTLPLDFLFDAQTDGSLPAPSATGGIITWTNVNIPANGAVSATLRVSVPTYVAPDNCGVVHYNAMTITHSAFPAPHSYVGDNMNRTARVVVDRQIYLRLQGFPSLQLPGEVVTYTVTIGNYDVEQLDPPFVLTVTLPVSFTYESMVDTVPSAPTVISNHILVWNDIPAIPAGGTFVFSFRTIADGIVGTQYPSLVEIASPRTRTCPASGTRIKIDTPFRVDKYTLSTTVVMGEDIGYQAILRNISPRNTYTLTTFEDILPDGTVNAEDGSNIFTQTAGLPYAIAPNDVWTSTVFSATYVGGGLGSSACYASFSGRKIYQESGMMHYYMADGSLVVNENREAEIAILPQISIVQEEPPWPDPVAYSHTQILTITLKDNRTRNLTDVTGLKVHWIAPSNEGVSYRLISSNPPTTSQSFPDYYWDNITLPGGGEAHIVLTLLAPMPPDDRQADFIAHVQVDEADDPSICVDQDDVRLRVRRGLRVLKRTYDPQVGPFGLARYRMLIYNDTGEDAHNVILTDVLPLEWTFEYAEPGYPQPISIDPPVWEIETIPAGGSVDLRFATRAYNYLGLWFNDFEASGPFEIYKDRSYTDVVDVQVISGIGMYKRVTPREAVIGDSVVYTITIYNGSQDKMRSFRITDTLPLSLTYVEMVEGPAPTWITPTPEGEMLVWLIDTTLNPQREMNLAFRVFLPDELYSGFYYNDLIGEAVNYDTGDRIILPPALHTAPLRIHGRPSAEIEKSVSPNPVMAGQAVTYTISVLSMADLTYTLRLTDILPYSLTYEGAIDYAPVSVENGSDGRQRIVWDNIELEPEEQIEINFRARVNRLAEGLYCNDVEFQMGSFSQPPQRELACLTVTPLPRIDGLVGKDDERTFIAPGDRLTYTIFYTNAATSELPLYNITLTEQITPLNYITPLPGGSWVDLGNGRYRFTTPGPLNPGEHGVITFVVQADTNVPNDWDRPLVNSVAFSYTTQAEALEFNLINNEAADMDAWQDRSPDLRIESLAYQPSRPRPGKPMTLTVRIYNGGERDADTRWDGSTDPNYLFVVELYLREHPSSPPTDVFDHQGGWQRDYSFLTWSGPLAMGESRLLTAHVTAPAEGIYDFYGQVDISDECTDCGYWGKTWGLIAESDETNNIYTYTQGTIEIRDTNFIYLPLVLRND